MGYADSHAPLDETSASKSCLIRVTRSRFIVKKLLQTSGQSLRPLSVTVTVTPATERAPLLDPFPFCSCTEYLTVALPDPLWTEVMVIQPTVDTADQAHPLETVTLI